MTERLCEVDHVLSSELLMECTLLLSPPKGGSKSTFGLILDFNLKS